jgi:hypothetical protein
LVATADGTPETERRIHNKLEPTGGGSEWFWASDEAWKTLEAFGLFKTPDPHQLGSPELSALHAETYPLFVRHAAKILELSSVEKRQEAEWEVVWEQVADSLVKRDLYLDNPWHHPHHPHSEVNRALDSQALYESALLEERRASLRRSLYGSLRNLQIAAAAGALPEELV